MKVQNIAIFLIFLSSCGKTREIVKEIPVEKRVPVPVPIPQDPIDPPAPPITNFIQAEAVVLTPYCGQCHGDDAFTDTEAALANSDAYNQLRSETMPPENALYPLGDNLRAQMLDYIEAIETAEECEESFTGDQGDDC